MPEHSEGFTFSIIISADKHSIILTHANHKIPNFKHQITNKSQIPISNDQNRFGISNFGHYDLFDICDLRFGISDTPTRIDQLRNTCR
jgi:hypothetical protein